MKITTGIGPVDAAVSGQNRTKPVGVAPNLSDITASNGAAAPPSPVPGCDGGDGTVVAIARPGPSRMRSRRTVWARFTRQLLTAGLIHARRAGPDPIDRSL